MTKTDVELSKRDKQQLKWLAKQRGPVWGGHLERGEPITDQDMVRWLELGLIEQIKVGYRITPAGRALLGEK